MEAKTRQSADRDTTTTSAESLSILLIEDNPGDVLLFRESLLDSRYAEAYAFEIDSVASLAEAHAYLAERTPDALVVDLGLPDSQGIDTLRQLTPARERSATIVITGNQDLVLAKEAVAEGADEFLVKGEITPGLCGLMISQAVRRHQLQTQLAANQNLQRKETAIREVATRMLALVTLSLGLRATLKEMLGLIFDIETLTCTRIAQVFLLDDDGTPHLAARRTREGALVHDVADVDLDGCPCAGPCDDREVRFRAAEPDDPPSCQRETGAHGCYARTMYTGDTAIGWFSIWVDADAEYDPFCARLVEACAHALATVVTHRRREIELQRLRNAIDQSPVLVEMTDTENRLIYINPAVEKTTGYLAEELLGRNPGILKSGLVDAHVYRTLWQTLEQGETWQGELINRNKSGELFWENASISPILDEEQGLLGYVGVKQDVTALRDYRQKIEHGRKHDALTNLANRNLLTERLNLAIKYCERDGRMLLTLAIDVDNFRMINETHGHEIGDQLLLRIAQRLTERVRDYDTVARLGNDEFVVVLVGIENENAIFSLAEKFIQILDAPLIVDDSTFRLSLSIGVSVYPQDGKDSETLLRHASMALAEAQQGEGRTFHLFGSEIEEELEERFRLLEGLRVAVERNELELFWQPQINPSEGHIAGVETLIRWNHPEMGMVSPVKFIPLAENSGLIVPIGRWVLETACHHFADFCRNHGVWFPVSVNVSSRQFHEPGFVDEVARILRETGLPPGQLILELTESLLARDPDEALRIMRQLSDLGTRLAIDDFGTGYSSFSYLKNLPIDQMKIDREFVKDLNEDPSDAIIVFTMIGMSHNLGLEVVAEGAETLEQVNTLRTYECDLVQGYYYSRPVPVTEFETLLGRKDWNREAPPAN